MMSPADREFTYLSPDGLALFCREYRPQAPQGTVVCLPGLTRNSRDFVALAQHLSDRYRVLTPDLRGRGQSQCDPDFRNYHPKVYHRDIAKLLAEQVQGRAVIVGTSLGGILAMLLAAPVVDAAVAEGIAGIVINDIGPELAKEGATRISTYVGVREAPRSWEEAVAQAKTYYADAYPDFGDADWLAFAQAFHREREDGSIVADYDPAIGDAVRATSSRTFDLWPVWASIKVPMLAVRGARSDLLSVATFARMLREKPGLVCIEVSNRGHCPQLNEAGVREGIDEFLAEVF